MSRETDMLFTEDLSVLRAGGDEPLTGISPSGLNARSPRRRG